MLVLGNFQTVRLHDAIVTRFVVAPRCVISSTVVISGNLNRVVFKEENARLYNLNFIGFEQSFLTTPTRFTNDMLITTLTIGADVVVEADLLEVTHLELLERAQLHVSQLFVYETAKGDASSLITAGSIQMRYLNSYPPLEALDVPVVAERFGGYQTRFY